MNGSGRAWVLALMLGSAGGLGCENRPKTPEATLEEFLQDIERGDDDRALARMTGNSRAWLTERFSAVRQAETGQPPSEKPTATDLLDTTQLTVLAPRESSAVVSPPGERATVRVSVGGGRSAEFRMVLEDGVWKVDLERTLGAGSN